MTPIKRDSPEPISKEDGASKRLKTSEERDAIIEYQSTPDSESCPASVSSITTQHSHARRNIQRSIAAVLSKDGFDAATPEAMESFTGLVEECTPIIFNLIAQLWEANVSSRSWFNN